MICHSSVRVLPTDGQYDESDASAADHILEDRRLSSAVRRSIGRTRQWLLGAQHSGGYWIGELQGDTILESEYVLLLAFLGREDSSLARRAAKTLIEEQLPDGGWATYPGGDVEVSVSTKAYLALKLTGHDPAADYMQRARAAIMAAGGADAVNSFTRFFLALLGQIPYDGCPAVPPETVLLPKWFPVHIYSISAWSRTILVPLSIVSACRPVREIEPRRGIRELFIKHPGDWPELRSPGSTEGRKWLSWDRAFRLLDRAWKWLDRRGLLPLRRRAIAAARDFMLKRFADSDGLGAIFPSIVWSIVALRSLGYEDDSPELEYCQQKLSDLIIEDGDSLRLQPCQSPVWDTALTLRTLAASGVASDNPQMQDAASWLLDHEIRSPGDWSETVAAAPGGWCFEHANVFYPDTDDTAMVLMALSELNDESIADALPPTLGLLETTLEQQAGTSAGLSSSAQRLTAANLGAACQRAEAWLLAMQNRDGGWGAFDRNNDRRFLCHVPFADHNAMIDPSTPDLTARILEALGQAGRRHGDPVVDRAVAYLRISQEADGSWFGRWGVNYIYGTWQVVTGLVAAGLASDDPLVASGVHWLLAHQQPSGGWGESPASYAQPQLRGQGPETASQTAWAVLALVAAGLAKHPATLRGIRFLQERQRADGTWEEEQFTGTGFPQVFYLRYHLYPVYFPLLALSRWAVAAGAGRHEEIAIFAPSVEEAVV